LRPAQNYFYFSLLPVQQFFAQCQHFGIFIVDDGTHKIKEAFFLVFDIFQIAHVQVGGSDLFDFGQADAGDTAKT